MSSFRRTPEMRLRSFWPIERILDRIRKAGIKYRSTVRGPTDMKINTDYGGSMIYWNEPDGHQWEILTVSYARQGN
jgi:hypothetical protein